jgi:23S rRNA (uracil1939-C5)-methyltransferase
MTDSYEQPAPLQPMQPDEFELELTSMAHGGSAIGRHEGRAIFVPYAIPGERITARITQDKGRFAYAEGRIMLDASDTRVQPRCPHFGPGKCGGCQWQHIDYTAQLEFKRQVVIDQLSRLGGLPDVPVHEVIGSPDAYQYRSNITFHVNAEGKLGFVATDDQHILPIEECHIIRPELLDLFYSLDLEGVAGLTRVRIQVGSDAAKSSERAIILSTEDNHPPQVESDMPASVNFLTDDDHILPLIGSPYLHYTVRGREFKVTAGGFFQVNLAQAEVLVDQVMTRLNLHGNESVLDLYAGAGLFTAFIAEKASLVASVESYAPAVADADDNLSEFDNVDLYEGPVEDVLPDLEGPFDAIVLDPPRTGVEGVALDAMAAIGAAKIVYVSCDPATFARDAKRLTGKGYRLLDVQPVDMFPQTWHIELVGTFEKV